jgi:hypothetical protein
MNTPVNYDDSMESDENQTKAWTAHVREAVAEFTKSVGQTSQQLAAAADKFATDSMRVIDDVTARAEQSASHSSEMARAASSAAEEARTVADSVRSALNDAAEKVRAETQAFLEEAVRRSAASQASDLQARLDEATRRAEEAFQSTQRLQSDLDVRLNNILAQAGGAAERVRGDLEERFGSLSAPPALDEMRAAIETRFEAAMQQAGEAMQNAERVRQELEEHFNLAMQRLEQSSDTERDAVAEAVKAAQEARDAANAATQQLAQGHENAGSSLVSESAQLVLERLETDYSLLTRLVQELHTRISGLAAAAPASQPTEPEPPAPVEPQPEPEPGTPWSSQPAPVNEVEEEPVSQPVTPPSWYSGYSEEPRAEEPAAEVSPAGAGQPEAETSPEPAAASTAAGESAIVQGRLLISIAPVPDFDRLLSLDGALGRMSGVANVTLADYAREEVTFRVEVQTPTSVEDFRRRLSQSAGSELDVVSASEGGLALRLAS